MIFYISAKTEAEKEMTDSNFEGKMPRKSMPGRWPKWRCARWRERAQFGGGGAGLVHVDGDDDFQVVVGCNRAIDETEDGEPHQVGTERGLEHVEFSEKAARQRNAYQRKDKEASKPASKGSRRPRPARSSMRTCFSLRAAT